MVQVRWEGFGGDLERLQVQLEHLLHVAEGRAALLMDFAGRLLTLAGDSPRFDLTTFVSLVAADFCATRELAQMLGEDQFQSVLHQGEEMSLYMVEVTPGTLLAYLYDRTTTLGLVRYSVQRALPGLAESITAGLGEARSADLPFGDEFADEALEEIERFFDGQR